KEKGGAFPGRRFAPDASAMALHDALRVGEAYAGALELAFGMQALEDPEQLARVLHVEADTIVLYPDHGFASCAGGVYLDHRLGASCRVLDRIVEEVLHDEAQEGRITAHLG